MKRYAFFVLATIVAQSTLADANNTKSQAPKEDKQRMEAKPSSVVGGAESGNLKDRTSEEERQRHEMEKQKQLYEYEGQYRKGL